MRSCKLRITGLRSESVRNQKRKRIKTKKMKAMTEQEIIEAIEKELNFKFDDGLDTSLD